MKPLFLGLFFLLISVSMQAQTIPFPNELEAASVTQDRIDDITTQAFPLGNGDLNALLWDRQGEICLRITKTDLWDARIDTSQDPPLLKMDVRNRTWSGGISRVPSWNAFPYPQPRCAALVKIGISQPHEPIQGAKLDLRRAVVTSGATSVRILADRNVILIDSPGAVSLEEIQAKQLPAAKLGETNGLQWLHMTMPGDVDYAGMEYALAVASRGTHKAISLVTSFDGHGPVLEAALRLASESLIANSTNAALVSRHEKEWEKFWAASGVRLADDFFEKAWYRNLYYMRCFSRPDTVMPITLFAGLASDTTGWHGAPTLNYNIEQVFWPMLVTNHVDSMQPYVSFLEKFAPRGRWLAKETYGVEGLFLPLNIFGPEYLVEPTQAKSKNARQIAYTPWTYTLGCTGFGLQNLWLRYKYAPDRAYLESIYPLLRDGAEFYANILQQCHDGELGPSYNPEQGPFGTFNNPVDLAYFRFLLRTAHEAAQILGRDAKRAERWQVQLARVPAYETTPLDGEPIIANWKGATENSVPVHNIVSPTVPVFPAEEVSWFSPESEKAIFARTLKWIKFRDDNAHVMVNVARARLSMPEAYTKTREHFVPLLTSNGLFTKWPGHGSFLAESWAFSGLTGELLLQSVGDIIRVFPAWPKDQDAAFSTLRTQGGFLVSAEQKAGKVVSVEIKSTVGGKLRILSPWDGSVLERVTSPGEVIRLTDKRTH